MSTFNHTDITTGAAANASVVNSPMGQLDAAIGQLTTLKTTAKTSAVAAANELYNGAVGGSAATDQLLKQWTEAGAYEMTSINYHNTYGVPQTATVKWPDGSAGTFTATAYDTTWEAIKSYTITHTTSGKTVTQSAVTFNSLGLVSSKPALTVA